MDELLDSRRHLPMEGAWNVRDLGGYATKEGHQTQWQRFLRSDSMHTLTQADQEKLIEYGLGTVVDLRMTPEVLLTPNVFSRSGTVDFYHLNFLGDERNFARAPEGSGRTETMTHSYYDYLEVCQENISKILRVLADAPDRVSAFHCHGGKDRTGLIAAMLLSLAGVPAETIAGDYGLSARYLLVSDLDFPDVGWEIDSWQTFQAAHCPPETMRMTLDYLDEKFGGVSGYLTEIGVATAQQDRLRERLMD